MHDQEFEEHRPLMFSIAYRMTGSVSDAEDIVQDAYLRLGDHQPDNPPAYVATVTTRLAIDHMRKAQVRRETYAGSWLPEPIIEDEQGPAERAELADSLSMAFLVLLESLSPTERAVFLLREVFGYGYGEIAEAVAKSEPACRQIFARARRRIDQGRPRFAASRAESDELVRRFQAATQGGDLSELVELLAPDVVFIGDSGGKGEAASGPVHGREQVAQLIIGAAERMVGGQAVLRPATVNGQPGLVGMDAEGGLIGVFAFDVLDGKIQAVRGVANPDKLQHLGPVSTRFHPGD